MATMMELQNLYETYIKRVETDNKKKGSYFAGILGMGDDPRKKEYHMEFYECVGQWVEAFLRTQPTPQETAEVVRWILGAAGVNRNSPAYWFLFVTQSHVSPLVPLLEQEECRRIVDWYGTEYSSRERLPAQEEIYKLLCSHAGIEAGTKRRIPWFK